jgi:general secretion pathway protein K
MTLWVMIFLVIVVTSFSLSTKWSIASTANFKQEAEAYYLALSGYDMALNYLMNDSDPQRDFIDQNGTFHVDTDHEPLPEKISLYNGDIDIKISDEQARLNLNMISPDRLRRLLQYAGVENDVQDEIVDSLADWLDPDELHHLNGAESDYYKEFGYPSKNRPLDTVEELLLVRGFSGELLNGSDTGKALSPFITVYGNNAMNVNTVGEEVMDILGVGQIDKENIVRYRNTESGGLSQVPPNLFLFGLNTAASTYLRIEISAGAKGSKIQYAITAIVRRLPAQNGFRVETVSWRQHVLYS